MVLGETGAGKTTLVNAMINYILGVTWDSTFKLKLMKLNIFKEDLQGECEHFPQMREQIQGEGDISPYVGFIDKLIGNFSQRFDSFKLGHQLLLLIENPFLIREIRGFSKEVTEKRIYKDLKEKYEEASKNAMPVEEVIKKMELDPIHPSTSEYIDLLIEGEKSEAKPGYLERIKELQHMREKVITMGKVARRDKVL
ncbi:unnamed protein product [Boreogadus saida]